MIVDPEYAGLKEEELNEEYSKVRYIASDPESNVWRELHGAESKARFLTGFWGVRDPSPGTPENEARQEYAKRVEEARNMYAAPMTPRGWDSDRGRVLLKYGKPDGVERHFQEFNKKPYEVWSYTQMNYQFVFIDRTQTGAFTLVHSTAPSEVRNTNWEQVATLNNTGSSSGGTR
jgi:GWxTD domain-containing protein